MDEISLANEHNPQDDDAAAGLVIASMNESSGAKKHNPQGLASMDQSSDVNMHTPQEEDAAADLTSASMDKCSDVIKNAHADVVAKGITSVLGPVMNGFDSGVEGALKSQSILASSIDRLTRELDKLLEDVPLPFATQHATRLSGIRRRVLTLNTSLRIIQRRMETIQRFLAGYASKAISRDNQEKTSLFSMENSYSTSRALSLLEVPPTKAMSSSNAQGKCWYAPGQMALIFLPELSEKWIFVYLSLHSMRHIFSLRILHSCALIAQVLISAMPIIMKALCLKKGY